MVTKKVVFVDCFDTIILRKIPAQKVKYLWANKMHEIYNNISCDEFFRAFLSCENKLKSDNQLKFGVGEYDLTQIAKTIFERFNIYKIFNSNINEESFINQVKQAYINAEKSVIYKNEKVVKILECYKNKGSKIFVVSDFYCGKDVLLEMFKFLNIENLFDEIYVSCDLFKTKSRGTMFEYLLQEYSLKAEDVVMIGDNPHSDNYVPNSMGIDSIKLKEKNNKFKLEEKLTKIKIPTEFKQIFNINKTHGFSNISFALFIFTKRLVENLKKNKTSNVFFLSREGEFLKRIFDYYIKIFNISGITSHYLQVSRNSILMAGLQDINYEKFETVLKETGKISAQKFMKTLGFSDLQISNVNSQVTDDFNVEYSNFLESEIFTKLKKCEEFINIYETSRNQQKNAFSKYVKTFNVDMLSEGLTVVDVGWKGTMQDLLVKFFENKINLTGYYLGYNGLGFESLNNCKHGLLYASAPFVESLEERIYKLDSLHFEQFLRASTNRVASYLEKDDKIEILYDSTIDDMTFYQQYIKDFQDEVFEKFEKICELCCNNSNYDIEKICLLLHSKMLRKISYKMFEFITICSNSHYDSFARIGYAQNNSTSKKDFILYVLRKIKLRLKFWLNKI